MRLRPSRGARGAAHRGARGLGRRRTRQSGGGAKQSGGRPGARTAARRSGPAVVERRRRRGAHAAGGPGDPRKQGGVGRGRAEVTRGGRSGAMALAAAFRRRRR